MKNQVPYQPSFEGASQKKVRDLKPGDRHGHPDGDWWEIIEVVDPPEDVAVSFFVTYPTVEHRVNETVHYGDGNTEIEVWRG